MAGGPKKAETGTSPTTTLYFGPVEIRNYGAGAAEEILLYPHPKIRITRTKSGSTVTTKVNTLHADGLGSIRAVTDAAGLKAETSTKAFRVLDKKSRIRIRTILV